MEGDDEGEQAQTDASALQMYEASLSGPKIPSGLNEKAKICKLETCKVAIFIHRN